jgi:hypothetical protein
MSVAPQAGAAGKYKSTDVEEGPMEEGDEYLTTPWVAPTREAAMAHREITIFGGGKAPLWETTSDDLGSLGSGVALYFKMLKYFSIMFFIMTLTATPSLFFSSQGERIPKELVDPLGLALVTVGNIGNIPVDIPDIDYNVDPDTLIFPGSDLLPTKGDANGNGECVQGYVYRSCSAANDCIDNIKNQPHSNCPEVTDDFIATALRKVEELLVEKEQYLSGAKFTPDVEAAIAYNSELKKNISMMDYKVGGKTLEIKDTTAAYLITFGDFLGSIIFILFMYWVIPRAQSVDDDIEQRNTTSADFSIFVEKLPT